MITDELCEKLIGISKTSPYSFDDVCRMYTNLMQTGLSSDDSLRILEDGLYHEYTQLINSGFSSEPIADGMKELARSNKIIEWFKKLKRKISDYHG